MTWRQRLTGLLDRGPGRVLLGALATALAKAYGQGDVCVSYDNGWLHRAHGRRFPTGPCFTYGRWTLARLSHLEADMRARSADYWFWKGEPAPGGTIVDVGAGTGEDILAFADAVGPSGRVVAIEAHPQSFALLSQLCALNGLTNVTLVEAAVSDREGTLEIDASAGLGASTVSNAARERVMVRAATLDSVLAEAGIGAIDLIKVNIEGGERFALGGMTEALKRCRSIVVAAHDFRADQGEGEEFRTRDVVIEALSAQGFCVVMRSNDSRAYVRDHVWGVRNT